MHTCPGKQPAGRERVEMGFSVVIANSTIPERSGPRAPGEAAKGERIYAGQEGKMYSW